MNIAAGYCFQSSASTPSGSVSALAVHISADIAHSFVRACLELVQHILKCGFGSLRLLGNAPVLSGSAALSAHRSALTACGSAALTGSELLFGRSGESLLDRKGYLALLGNGKHLYLDLLTLRKMILDVIYKCVGNFGDVDHTRYSRLDLNKCSELGNACYFALINFSYIWLHKSKITLLKNIARQI